MALSIILKRLNSIGKHWLPLKEFRRHIFVQRAHSEGSFTTFVASDPSSKARVAILIKSSSKCSCPIQIKLSFLYPHGRYVPLSCDHMDTSFTLANVYAPNLGQIGFLRRFLRKSSLSHNSSWSWGKTLTCVYVRPRIDLPFFKLPHHSMFSCPLLSENVFNPIISLIHGW